MVKMVETKMETRRWDSIHTTMKIRLRLFLCYPCHRFNIHNFYYYLYSFIYFLIFLFDFNIFFLFINFVIIFGGKEIYAYIHNELEMRKWKVVVSLVPQSEK